MSKQPTVQHWVPLAVLAGGIALMAIGFLIQYNAVDASTFTGTSVNHGATVFGSFLAWTGAITALVGAVGVGVRLALLSLHPATADQE